MDIRVILGLYWGYIGLLENRMETTILPLESGPHLQLLQPLHLEGVGFLELQ